MDIPNLQDLSLHQRHIITVHNRTAQIMHQAFQPVHPPFQPSLLNRILPRIPLHRPLLSRHTGATGAGEEGGLAAHEADEGVCEGTDGQEN